MAESLRDPSPDVQEVLVRGQGAYCTVEAAQRAFARRAHVLRTIREPPRRHKKRLLGYYERQAM